MRDILLGLLNRSFDVLCVWLYGETKPGTRKYAALRVAVFWCVGSVNCLPTEIVHAIRLFWLGATFVYFYD